MTALAGTDGISVHAPRSAVPGALWPAVPDWRRAVVLALQQQFERSQWWPADALAAQQSRQAAALLSHAYGTVPFYRDRLAKVRLRRDGAIRPEEWRKIPLLTRADLQARFDELQSRAVPEAHGSVSEIHSSGSTGRPVRALRTKLSMLFWEAFTHRDHDWHGRDRRRTLAVIRHAGAGEDPYPHGTTAPNWGRESTAVYTTGPSMALNVNTPVDQQVEWLQRSGASYLLTFPSNAERLARHCLAEGARLPDLEQVQFIAEAVRPELRELIREAWGARATNTYSAREIGYMAIQCPASAHLHVQSEGVLLEVLRDDGTPCEPGEVGRVVVTPLHNFAMPLIRYDIGDYAEVGGPCPCGRGLPVLRRVLGRTQTIFRLPGGETRWTLLSNGEIAELLGLAPIRQYQFVQTEPARVLAKLVVARPLTGDEEAAVAAWLRGKLDYPFKVDFAYSESLPRTAGGKFFDFVSEVGAGHPAASPAA